MPTRARRERVGARGSAVAWAINPEPALTDGIDGARAKNGKRPRAVLVGSAAPGLRMLKP